MRILTTLTYYSPHISGLTIYARRLIRRLVEDGHDVTVLTSHYERGLPRRELIDGATVVRTPVLLRASKGSLMPLLPWHALRLAARHDVVHVHLPQFEGSTVAMAARVTGTPVVTTYHCDIQLPPGIGRHVFTPAIRASHYLAGKLSDRIVVNTEEYARSARLPKHFHRKVSTAYPPVELSEPCGPSLRARVDLSRGPIVGFVGRFAEEKGVATLVDAAPRVLAAMPDARFVLAGLTDQVPGEDVYARLLPKMRALGASMTHIGVLTDSELREFYEAIDVLALPSVNATESFGMVQAEAMLAGTPVISTAIAGVREVIDVTGMGISVPPRDEAALAAAIVRVLREPGRYRRPPPDIEAIFDPRRTVETYERIFEELTGKRATAVDIPLAAVDITPDVVDERDLVQV